MKFFRHVKDWQKAEKTAARAALRAKLLAEKPKLVAPEKVRELLAKLERLADPANHGTTDERAAAKLKAERLRAKYDFTGFTPLPTVDIFADIPITRTHAGLALPIYRRNGGGFEVETAVKQAIEGATKLHLFHRQEDLMAEVTAATADKLAVTAIHIAHSICDLWETVSKARGITQADRPLFIMGCTDGILNEPRAAGQPLPHRARVEKLRKAKKNAVTVAPGLSIHPYQIALELGKQIRFSVPLETIRADLEQRINPQLEAVK